MATITFKKSDEYLAKIAKLEALARDEVCGKAIYGAAEIVTDEIRAQLEKVPTDDVTDTFWAQKIGPQTAQKKGLEKSLGISHMQDDGSGFLNVKVGFDGYNKIKTNRWPKGQPNQMVARSVARGTSFMVAHDFVKTAMRKVTRRAREYMKESVDASIKGIMEKG